jgi:hypothetical protein
MCIELVKLPGRWTGKTIRLLAAFVTSVVIAGGMFSEFRFSAGLLSLSEHAGLYAGISICEKNSPPSLLIIPNSINVLHRFPE